MTAETIPWVTLPARVSPLGLPMATTFSPTRSWSELPNSAYGRFLAFILMTAMSVSSSAPTMLASYSSPFSRTTLSPDAFSTTWALVRM